MLLSHPKFHQKTLELCINITMGNGYPLELIFQRIHVRLKKLLTRNWTLKIESIIETENTSEDTRKY